MLVVVYWDRHKIVVLKHSSEQHHIFYVYNNIFEHKCANGALLIGLVKSIR